MMPLVKKGEVSMRVFNFAILGSAVIFMTGCASTAQRGPTARTINYEEATAFERGLRNSQLPSIERPKFTHFVQPTNKKEPCKVPSSQDQMDRNNFRAFWDGGCKDGYAFGLGRDIAISDTHHTEEITIHNGTGNNIDSPAVLYDFVNNRALYRAPADKFPASSWMKEEIQNSESGFFVSYTTGVTDESGNSSIAINSPLRPTRILVNDRRNVAYRFTDNSGFPAVDLGAASFSAETIDPRTQVAGGVVIVRHFSGEVRHLKLGGASPETVVLPPEYTNELSGKIKSVQDALAPAQSNLERVRQMEREYLYLACNGKHSIDGLDNQIATKICTWRGQFKAPYEKALAKYTSDMEGLKQKAEAATQQRLAQQQIDVQQKRLQQQQTQLEVQQITNALNQFGLQMQNSNQQMLNNVINQPAPQVNFTPFTAPGGNSIRCVTVGSVTNCRQ